MSTGVLGNPEVLRDLWCGPLADLMIKLTGKDGPEYQTELGRFLRKEPCWGNGQIAQAPAAPKSKPTSPAELDWQKAYGLLGLRDKFLKFAGENPVESKDGFWNVPVIEGLTMNVVVDALKHAGSNVWLYRENLDKSVPINDRHPRNGSYSVRFAANVEADEGQKNLSANDLESRGVKGITLLERLLLELAYFITTGNHLDVKSWTLCSGSRGSDGSVPSVDWDTDGRKVYVYWRYPDDRRSGLRTRAAVS